MMKKYVKEILPYVVVIIIVLLVKQFIVSPIRVNGASMEDTLKNKDIMLLDKISYRLKPIKRFDIIVIQLPGELIIKRVIGLPGEYVSYKDNELYIDGKHIKENYNHKITEDFKVKGKIPDNTYFVLGDNRINSTDSRIIGAIPKENILGHAVFTVYPLDRIGIKK